MVRREPKRSCLSSTICYIQLRHFNYQFFIKQPSNNLFCLKQNFKEFSTTIPFFILLIFPLHLYSKIISLRLNTRFIGFLKLQLHAYIWRTTNLFIHNLVWLVGLVNQTTFHLITFSQESKHQRRMVFYLEAKGRVSLWSLNNKSTN